MAADGDEGGVGAVQQTVRDLAAGLEHTPEVLALWAVAERLALELDGPSQASLPSVARVLTATLQAMAEKGRRRDSFENGDDWTAPIVSIAAAAGAGAPKVRDASRSKSGDARRGSRGGRPKAG